jgi:hypothetical protein
MSPRAYATYQLETTDTVLTDHSFISSLKQQCALHATSSPSKCAHCLPVLPEHSVEQHSPSCCSSSISSSSCSSHPTPPSCLCRSDTPSSCSSSVTSSTCSSSRLYLPPRSVAVATAETNSHSTRISCALQRSTRPVPHPPSPHPPSRTPNGAPERLRHCHRHQQSNLSSQ